MNGPLDASGGSAPVALGLVDGADALVVTPDGHGLYVAATNAGSVSHFVIDPAGNLIYAGCIGDLPGCATMTSGAAGNADAIRAVLDIPEDDALHTALRGHREQLLDRAHVLTEMVRIVDHYIEHGVAMPELKTPRIVQVTINVTDLAKSITFYRDAFDASFNEEISSFQFGVWPTDDFFLLSVTHEANKHGVHHGPAGAPRFGFLVGDVDAAHRRALAAGATEVQPPCKVSWKPRTSCVADPSGNHIDLYQG